ncbi:MAG: hypothetical protein PHV82_09640, partial [Victivallaceae bacterium]|nr:hypothetical protein [Victivallaceae bacterium]
MKCRLLNLQVQCGAEWYDRKRPELKLKIENRPNGCRWLRASFVNSSNHTVRFGGFKFDFKAFGNIAGERIRIYREGWTTASACGTVRYGECDFAMHPEYLKLAVTDPAGYDSNTPNRFSAEHVMVLNDRDTAYSLLIGFSSSAHQLTRLVVELDESGVRLLSAFSSG